MHKWLVSIGAFVFLFTGLNAHAELFSNSYVSFQRPPSWECKREGTEYVCSSKFAKKAKEAIIILTAKEQGPTDSLAAYEAYLKTPKTLANPKGKPTRSKVLHIKKPTINGQLWVDGMHLGSEVSTYYTRYVATIKNGLAILVTFSAHKAHYTKYTNDFIRAVKSLQVTAKKNMVNTTDIRPRDGSLIGERTVPIPTPGDDTLQPPPSPPGGKNIELIGFALLISAIGLYFVLKKKS